MSRRRNTNKVNPTKNPQYSERTQSSPNPPPAQQSPAPAPAPKDTNPFGLSFVTPTEIVQLPSLGEYYPLNSPLHGVTEVEIKHMTAKEEDILSNLTGDNSKIFSKLIDSLLVTDGLQASDFLEEDKMAVLLSARRTGYGSTYSAESFCENCKKPTKHEFDLQKVGILNPEKSNYDPETNTFTLELPMTKINLNLVSDQETLLANLETEKKQKEKYNLPFNYTLAFLQNAIISANGVQDAQMLKQLTESIPAADAKSILNFYQDCRPTIDTTQEVQCSVCGTVSEKEAPISWAFFRTDF